VSQKELRRLSWHECLELLGRQSVGRLIYHDETGPVAEPVNYAIAADTIILRIEGGSKRQAMTQPLLAFEVDHIDPDHKTGWSVIARGVGQEVPLDDVVALLHELRQAGVEPPLPWASGIHNIWLRITIKTLSGRMLGRESSPLIF
jgi:uncharacterized protein